MLSLTIGTKDKLSYMSYMSIKVHRKIVKLFIHFINSSLQTPTKETSVNFIHFKVLSHSSLAPLSFANSFAYSNFPCDSNCCTVT